MTATIFALSSGTPPAAIAVVRISGPQAASALTSLTGSCPAPRVASLRRLRDGDGETLDRALVLWFPGPASATGEDLAELHLHGGRAVVAAVQGALAQFPGLRAADPGEFTRRAFANGRIDLAEAEGLADLLSAETELQRRLALSMAEGALSTHVEIWRQRLLALSAKVEAVLDFGEEDDVTEITPQFAADLRELLGDIEGILAAPRAEALREGFRVVIAGPPNAGKSSLFNTLIDDEAAIATPIAGTTRDVLTRPVAFEGIPFVFADTAGLRKDGADVIERIGIARAAEEMGKADLVLWLGEEGQGEGKIVWEIESFSDRQQPVKSSPRHRLSSVTGYGVDELRADLVKLARSELASPNGVVLNARQRALLVAAADSLQEVHLRADPLLVAECLREARAAFDRLSGRATTEDMLDALFGRFCIGK